MKTAISIPDLIFREGEKLAARRRVSRSELYVTALEEYLDRHRDDAVTAALNEVYGRTSSALDPGLAALQALSLPADSWK
jgi:metal-responsive CopG/Arc/MetJ family transcriptional regulator